MKLKNALLGMFTAAALLAVSGCQKAEAPAPAQTEAETAKETEAVKAEAETAAAKAAVEGIKSMIRDKQLPVKSLQEFHAEITDK